MIIGSISENLNEEKRVAITPDIVKKYISLGLDLHLSKDYAVHLGIKDEVYEAEGANISTTEKIISNSNALLQMNILSDKNLDMLKKANIALRYLSLIRGKGDISQKSTETLKEHLDDKEFKFGII